MNWKHCNKMPVLHVRIGIIARECRFAMYRLEVLQQNICWTASYVWDAITVHLLLVQLYMKFVVKNVF